jgi:replicative DNA helicase
LINKEAELKTADDSNEKRILNTVIFSAASREKDLGKIVALDPAVFYFRDNRAVFEAVVSLHRAGLPLDGPGIRAKLIEQGTFMDVGGDEVFDENFSRSDVQYFNFELLVEKLLEGARRRDLMHMAKTVQSSLNTGEDVLNIETYAQGVLVNRRSIIDPRDCTAGEALERFRTLQNKCDRYVPLCVDRKSVG